MGGQWVHGDIENVAFELAWPLGLLEKGDLINRSNRLFDSSGTPVEQTIANDIQTFFFQTGENFLEDAEKANRSSGEYFHKQYFID